MFVLVKKNLFSKIVFFLFYYSDTSSNTLAWTLCFLCQRPKIQEELKAEVDKVIGNDADISEDQLKSLVRIIGFFFGFELLIFLLKTNLKKKILNNLKSNIQISNSKY